jgi:hypothetical protein
MTNISSQHRRPASRRRVRETLRDGKGVSRENLEDRSTVRFWSRPLRLRELPEQSHRIPDVGIGIGAIEVLSLSMLSTTLCTSRR